MVDYRTSRNIENSIKDYLTDELKLDLEWSALSVEFADKAVQSDTLPAIRIHIEDNTHRPVEVGSTNTRREVLVIIDVYGLTATDKLDLKDCVILKAKKGIPYYEYSVDNNKEVSKVRIKTMTVTIRQDRPVFSNIEDKSTLDKSDKHRQRIVLLVKLDIVEG